MPVFGLTGDLGCGKSTVLELLKKKGAIIFDADKVIHEYYKDKKNGIYKKISALFPQAIGKKGIDRKKLGEIVFSDREKLRKLERIVHPLAVKDLKIWLKRSRQSNRVAVAEVPLLFEKNLENIFDGIIVIYVKRDVLLKRIKKNLNLPKTKALARLVVFKPVKEKNRKADFIINNSFGIETLKKGIDILWEKLNCKFKGENKN